MAKFKRFEASNKKKDKFKSVQRDDSFPKMKTATKYKMKYTNDDAEFSTQYYQSRV